MNIALNGVSVPGFNIKVLANFELAAVQMSGKTSYTPKAETGDKAKTLSVSLQIRFIDAKDLTKIIDLAEAKNASDERQVYNIINNTAQALRIHQVVFDGNVQVREDASLNLWTVTFELTEYHSTPEKKQQRTTAKKVTAQQVKGTKASKSTSTANTTTPAPTTTPPAADQKVELTTFEKVLKRLDDALQ